MKRVAVQLLADSLGLSRVTVWKALNNREGVSPATAQRVRKAAEKMMQEDGAEEAAVSPVSSGNVTLLVSRADTASFWMQMVDQVASEMHHKKLRLHYIPIDAMHLSISDLETMLRPDHTDGLIIINIYDETLIRFFQRLDIPKIYFDTTPGHRAEDLRGDLVLLAGQSPVHELTKELIETGCRQLGFIGDLCYAYTNILRWEGYCAAMRESKLPVEERFCLTDPIGAESYQECIASFLDGLSEMPDAFVCVSDFVAFVTLSLLADRGYRVPEDVRLTGYDDSQDFMLDNHKISTVHVQNGLLGKRMVHQLLYRIDNPTADFEEIFIYPKVLNKN